MRTVLPLPYSETAWRSGLRGRLPPVEARDDVGNVARGLVVATADTAAGTSGRVQVTADVLAPELRRQMLFDQFNGDAHLSMATGTLFAAAGRGPRGRPPDVVRLVPIEVIDAIAATNQIPRTEAAIQFECWSAADAIGEAGLALEYYAEAMRTSAGS